VSGNLEAIGWTKLESAALRQYFDFGSFSNESEQREAIFRYGVGEARRRAGAEARVCIFGDTPSDIEAARRADVPIVAVATGIFTREQLAEFEPDLCLGCCTELLSTG
jgi:phosphoglycolate phosphatase-like HAD superfamily hydrolase